MWDPERGLGAGSPWTLAGHALGAWTIAEPGRPPFGRPTPGLIAAPTPLIAYDSVAVAIGEGGAALGFQGSLARAAGLRAAPAKPRSTGVVSLAGGSFGFDENALAIERGDSLRWIRAEAASGTRGTAGSLDHAGRHVWGASTRVVRRRHALEAGFAQRGSSQRIATTEEQSAKGESGYVRYAYALRSVELALRAERAWDVHESFGELIDVARRDAQENAAAFEATHARGGRTVAVAAEVRQARVRRDFDPLFTARATSGWAHARWDERIGPVQAHAALGAGKLGRDGELEYAPEASLALTRGAWRARGGVTRVLHAVAFDLPEGEPPFVQRTWAGFGELEYAGTRSRARAAFLGGRTLDRAIVRRFPIEDLWLRAGLVPDLDSYDFGLVMGAAMTRFRRFELAAEAFGLTRSENPSASRVDPAVAGRAELAWLGSAFQGDLGIVVAAGAEGVGERESESDATVVLPAYVTSLLRVRLELADAIITLRMRNLEDRVREHAWTDPFNEEPALGGGREFRVSLTMRLSN